MTIEPFYLYESVTHSVVELENSGLLEDDDDKIIAPISQHLCLFYKAQIDEDFDKLLLHINKAEVEVAAWAEL
jgi:hypothetical protein